MGTIALDARLTAIHDYWRRKRGYRPMPARKDIDPVDIPKLLADLKILERVGHRLRFRLVGSAIATAYGRDPTGKFLDEVLERDHDVFTIKSYMSVLETGRPAVSRGKMANARDIEFGVTRLLLPLSENGATVSMILAALSIERFRFGDALADPSVAAADEAEFEFI